MNTTKENQNCRSESKPFDGQLHYSSSFKPDDSIPELASLLKEVQSLKSQLGQILKQVNHLVQNSTTTPTVPVVNVQVQHYANDSSQDRNHYIETMIKLTETLKEGCERQNQKQLPELIQKLTSKIKEECLQFKSFNSTSVPVKNIQKTTKTKPISKTRAKQI